MARKKEPRNKSYWPTWVIIQAPPLLGAINLFNISQRGKGKAIYLPLPTAADLGFFFSLCKVEESIFKKKLKKGKGKANRGGRGRKSSRT